MMNNITDTVKHLIIINVLFFLGTQYYGEAAYQLLALFSFASPNFHWFQNENYILSVKKVDGIE